MPKFRKPPVVIELTRFRLGVETEGVCLGYRYENCPVIKDPSTLLAPAHVHTMHDGQIVLLADYDWIAAEPDGIHFYPIKPEVVEKWERVEEPL